MAALVWEGFGPVMKDVCLKCAEAKDGGRHSTTAADTRHPRRPCADFLMTRRAEKLESLFLTLDWAADITYVVDVATRTTEELTDVDVRECLTRWMRNITTNATNETCTTTALEHAIVSCETPDEWAAPPVIIMLLAVACIAGIVGDFHRIALLDRAWKAEDAAEQEGYFGVVAATGSLSEIKRTKQIAAIVSALLEDGLSIVATITLETFYIDGPWGDFAKLNVAASIVTTLIKIFWAIHNKLMEEHALQMPGGLCKAAACGNIDDVNWLLDTPHGNPNDRAVGEQGQNCPALIMAAANGHVAVVKRMIKTGKVDLEAKDACDNTALTFAAQMGATEVVRTLLQAGANLDYVQPECNMTAFEIAKYGFCGIDLTDPEPPTPIEEPTGHWSTPQNASGKKQFLPGTGDTKGTVGVFLQFGATEKSVAERKILSQMHLDKECMYMKPFEWSGHCEVCAEVVASGPNVHFCLACRVLWCHTCGAMSKEERNAAMQQHVDKTCLKRTICSQEAGGRRNCDGCGSKITAGAATMSCRACDYDLCETCSATSTESKITNPIHVDE